MRPTRVIAICLGAFGAVLAGRSAVRANRVRKRLRRLKICLKSRCFGTPSSFAFQGAVGVVIAEDDPGCLVSVVPIFRWSPLIWQPSISPCITTRRGTGCHIFPKQAPAPLPLRTAGGIIAAIGFKTRRPRRISRGTWRLLEDFADQTIFAIDDRRYHQPRKVSGVSQM